MILRAVLNLKFKNKILFKLEILPGISISLQIDQKAYLQITPIFLRKILSGKHKSDAYSTKYSQAVTHPSTNLAQCCLTSVIRRELVLSTWYGRRQRRGSKWVYYSKLTLRRISKEGISACIKVAWPSGLRRWFKAPVSSEAWVRIPPLPSTF